MYEGYGPGGVALLIECLTDNRNRAAAEVRTIMSRNGGQMADPGSVAYNFSRKGVVSISKAEGVSEDDILLAVLEAGAEEVIDRGGGLKSSPTRLTSSRRERQSKKQVSIMTLRKQSSLRQSVSNPMSRVQKK